MLPKILRSSAVSVCHYLIRIIIKCKGCNFFLDGNECFQYAWFAKRYEGDAAMEEILRMLDELTIEQKKKVIRLLLDLRESECSHEPVSDSSPTIRQAT